MVIWRLFIKTLSTEPYLHVDFLWLVPLYAVRLVPVLGGLPFYIKVTKINSKEFYIRINYLYVHS